MSLKPRLFIGSSSKALPLARRFAAALTPVAKAVTWEEAPEWRTMWSTLDALFEVVEGYDFGLFVFAPDDTLVSRGRRTMAVRDNVILELGLFLGALGRDRTFAVMREPATTRQRPKVHKDDHVGTPTDLLGITLPRFHGEGAALARSVSEASKEISRRIAEHGRRPSRLNLIEGWGYNFGAKEFSVVIPQHRLVPRKRLEGKSLLLVARVAKERVLAENDPDLAVGVLLPYPKHVTHDVELAAGGRAFRQVEPGARIDGYLFTVPPGFRVPHRPTISAILGKGGDLIATRAAKAKKESSARRGARRARP